MGTSRMLKLLITNGPILGILLLCPVCSFPQFVMEVPNADKVPDPCSSGLMVGALGHVNSSGGGPRNAFGLDFGKVKSWSRLCPLDSDGDGFTNGQELGDPDCVWTPGALPQRLTNISHPGVCTPIDSTICRNKNVCRLLHQARLETSTSFIQGTDTKQNNGLCVNEFSTFASSMLGVGVLIIVLLTIFKLTNNRELKYRIEYGHPPPGGCCASIPHSKPGLSWDP
ncbi:ABC transporter [Paragonimus skrjabini miyazakii]|uniref:ABC transporter n=1 Tax=Paragonimus skrjabini miyazakii TaxID=59628 RepID=A0A8S9Z3N6_9TREM|nr:ABC transporter [Paragonimus skrjabini miyazakii]